MEGVVGAEVVEAAADVEGKIMIFRKMSSGCEKKSSTTLETINEELKKLVLNIQNAFPGDLRMVAIFGSLAKGNFNPQSSDINILMVIDKLDLGGLERLHSIINNTMIQTLISPILLRKEELPHFAEVFPIKVLEIKNCYKVLSGDDLVKGIIIEKRYLRLRCEQELRNILSRMRRGLVLGFNNNNLLASNFSRFFAYYLSTLKAISYLMDYKDGDPIIHSAKSLQIDTEAINKLIELKKRSPKAWSVSDIENACYSFLEVLEKTISALDSVAEK